MLFEVSLSLDKVDLAALRLESFWHDQGSFEELQKPRFFKGSTTWQMWSPLCYWAEFRRAISPAKRVPNSLIQHQTAGFGSLFHFLTWSGKFRRVAETSFCKGRATWATWSPLCYRAEFRRADVVYKSSAKQSESMPKSRILESLAFADMIKEVSKSCRISNQCQMKWFGLSSNFLVISTVWNKSKNGQKPWVNSFTFWWNFWRWKLSSILS